MNIDDHVKEIYNKKHEDFKVNHSYPCKLCQKNSNLCKSHIIPAFVYNWIKNTSATGYLRQAINPNKRLQDGKKIYLFCEECEALFSNWEKKFSEKVFNPYVNEVLDEKCFAKETNIFTYDEWLLKFLISIQYRCILWVECEKNYEDLPKKFISTLYEAKIAWQKYLLLEREDTYIGDHHVLFLQNISNSEGPLELLPNQINTHILRSVDQTPVVSKTKLGIYTQLGPIILYTSLRPGQLPSMYTSRLKKKGNLSTSQKIDYGFLGQFILIDRPKQLSALPKVSKHQQNKISLDIEKDPEKTNKSLSLVALKADHELKSKK